MSCDTDEKFMQSALEEAVKGMGRTSPNPCVGAVVVKDGAVVGRGYHHRAGTPHAEIHALADAGDAGRGATMYVTLEPCNHTGRTPPCSLAVLDAGISRVVIGMADPNPVARGGADFLRSHGVEVAIGVLEEECRRINHPFIKHSVTGLPWVVMKAGMSLDARISYRQGQGGAITGAESKQRVHQLRDRLDAILIGIGTALVDDPSLTTRLSGASRDPLRVVLDTRLRLPVHARMLTQQSAASTWIFCSEQASEERRKKLEQAGAVVHCVAATEEGGDQLELKEVLTVLGRQNITSLLVEGGAVVHGSFLRRNLVDEVMLFTAPLFIGDSGIPLASGLNLLPGDDRVRLAELQAEQLGKDILLHGLIIQKGT